MPPEGYHYPQPPTIITQITPTSVPVKATNVGTPPQLHASPAAMSDPTQAARIMQQTQKQLAVTTSLVTGDPEVSKVIFRDITILNAPKPFAAIKHGLGRKYISWRYDRPRALNGTGFCLIVELTPADFVTLGVPDVDRAIFLPLASPFSDSLFDLQVW